MRSRLFLDTIYYYSFNSSEERKNNNDITKLSLRKKIEKPSSEFNFNSTFSCSTTASLATMLLPSPYFIRCPPSLPFFPSAESHSHCVRWGRRCVCRRVRGRWKELLGGTPEPVVGSADPARPHLDPPLTPAVRE